MESLKIKVDVKRRTTENINLQQGYTYPIELTILDNGKEYDCTGAIPQIHFAKSNGTFNIKTKDITIEGNKVSFILDSEATNRSGTGKLQAVLTRNGFTFGSWAIFCNIFENVIQDGATEDKNVIDVLTELKDEVTKAKPLADSLNANIPKAQPLVNSLNTQIPQATEIAREIESIIEEGGAVDKRELGEYKKDFEGGEHDTLNSRLNRDFDNLHQRMNDSSLLAYEGTSIKADNTYLGLTKDTVIKGRTLQNIFDYTKVVSSNALKHNNGIFSSNRVTWDYNFKVSDVILKPSTEYTVFIDYNKNTYTGVAEFRSTITSTLLICPSTLKMESSGVYRYKTTTPSEINLNTSLIYFKGDNPNNVEGNFSFQIMILEGDHTQTPLEELPFIEGIESTGDKSKNLVNLDLFQHKQLATANIGDSIVFNESVARFTNTTPIKIKPNGAYSLYVKSPYSVLMVGVTNDKITERIEWTNNYRNKTITSEYVYLSIRKDGNVEITEEDITAIKGSIQLEQSINMTSYEPYYDGYKISGKSIGKNLFNKENMEISNLYVPQGQNNIVKAQTLRGFIMKIKPNTNYVLSKSYRVEDCFRVYGSIDYPVLDGNAKSLAYGDGSSQLAFNTEQFKYIFCVCYTNKEGGEVDEAEIRKIFDTIQLEESTKLTLCEPYKESSYSYILNEPLRSLPNGVCDTIDLETGVLTRRVEKVVLDGSGDWHKGSIDSQFINNTNFFYTSMLDGKSKSKYLSSYICDTFIRDSSWNSGNECVCLYADSSKLRIRINYDRLVTQDVKGFKQWLQSNPITVLYELAEPTTEQLTPQQLKSFDTTTHIISDNKLMPIVSTKIPSDVNAVVQNLRAENKNLEKELDSAIEELNNTDIDLIAIDWETDYRLCELEWTLLDTMKVETLAENKTVENGIMSRYEQAKILIKNGKYNKSTIEKQLTTYYNRNYLTKEEFNELMQLMNPIGEVETLEELDKVDNM